MTNTNNVTQPHNNMPPYYVLAYIEDMMRRATPQERDILMRMRR